MTYPGNYTKYSRLLSQSEWIINSEKLTASSVEEILFGSIKEHFRQQGAPNSANRFTVVRDEIHECRKRRFGCEDVGKWTALCVGIDTSPKHRMHSRAISGVPFSPGSDRPTKA